MFRKSPTGKHLLLNPTGQQRLEHAYGRKARPKCSFVDFADGYLQRLRDDGALPRFLLPGLDPFATLASAAESGVDD